MSPNRRRSAHDAAAAAAAAAEAAEAAARRETMNYALGNLGGKQKSWMAPATTSAQSPKLKPPSVVPRKRGRPPARATTGPTLLHQPTVGQTSSSAYGRYPPSNSTSPQLANIISPQTRASPVLSPSANAGIPSPSSSENMNVESVVVRTTHSNGREKEVSGAERAVASGKRFMEEAQETGSPPQRPAKQARYLNSPMQQENIPMAPQETFPIASHDQPASEPQNQPLHTVRSPILESHGSSRVPARQTTHSRTQLRPVVRNGDAPQFQSPFGPPGVLSRMPTHGSTVPSQHASASAAQSPLAQSIAAPASSPNLTYTDMANCWSLLQRFLQQHTVLPEHSREVPRINVLKDALDKKDWDYLTLHQYYCLYDLEPQSLPSSVTHHPNVRSAIDLLSSVLDTNEGLSPNVRRFFANFPMALSQTAKNWPRGYKAQQQRFMRFMSSAPKFSQLEMACTRRRYPPLVRELYYHLSISSIILQRIVFTYMLRKTWNLGDMRVPPDPRKLQFETEAINMFVANQSDFIQHQSLRPANASLKFDERDLALENTRWAPQFRQLCNRHENLLQISPGPHSLPLRSPLLQQPHQNPIGQAVPHPVAPRGRGRPPTYAAMPSMRQQLQPIAPRAPLIAVYEHQGNNNVLLPPPTYHAPQQRQANPARFALNQAGLRSPELRPQAKDLVLYQYLKGFVKPPTCLLEARQHVECWRIHVSAETLQSFPVHERGMAGAPPLRRLSNNNETWRLRCIKWPHHDHPDEHAWATADTSWIPHVYFTFNGSHLHPRKKLQWGKDLPIDITSLVKEGGNTLEIAIVRQSNDHSYLSYRLAIEIIGVERHDKIKETCLSANVTPASQILDSIKAKLLRTPDDDEDIAIVESNLLINLFDPFSASQICEIPARGRSCPHNHCFDLETFLQTRQKKGDVSLPDVWRCPICGADARPQNLIVDGFLQEVYKELEAKGILRTRSIIVDTNGTWKPKVEPSDTTADDRPSPESTSGPIVTAGNRSASVPDVIDLSD